MPVLVYTRYQNYAFANGASWHTDEENRLHVRDEAKCHIAVFNHGDWVLASTEETPTHKA